MLQPAADDDSSASALSVIARRARLRRAAALLLSLCVPAACFAHRRLAGPGYPAHPAPVVDVCAADTIRKQNADRLNAATTRCFASLPPPVIDECSGPTPDTVKALERCQNLPADFISDDTARLEEARRTCVPGTSTYDYYDGALKKWRVAYDADKLETCLSKSRATRRGKTAGELLASFPSDPDCEAILVPLAREGDTCVDALECPAGTFCEAAEPTVQKLTCLRGASVGEQCWTRTCDRDTADCVKGRCEAHRAVGQTCESQQGAASCVSGSSCNATTGRCEKQKLAALGEACGCCGEGSCLAGVCVADKSVPLGLACANDQQCAETSSCLAGRCVPDKSVPDGTVCTDDRQCAGSCSSCTATKSAGAERLCERRGHAHDACAREGDCVYGYRCTADADAGTVVGECIRFSGPGEKCSGTSECAEPLGASFVSLYRRGSTAQDLVCDPRDGCTERRSEGEPCSGKETCAAKLACLSGVCRTPPEAEGDLIGEGTEISWRLRGIVGEACSADGGTLAPCASALYCRSGTCQPRTPTGTPCASDDQCTSGVCVTAQHACGAVVPEHNGKGCEDRNPFAHFFPLAMVALPRVRATRRRRP
jgi:hypothetical protein